MRFGLVVILILSSFSLFSCASDGEVGGNTRESPARTVEVTREVTVERTVVSGGAGPGEEQPGGETTPGGVTGGEVAGQGGATGEKLPGPAVPPEADIVRNIGAEATLETGNSVTVLSGESGIPPEDSVYEAREGMEFFVIEAEVCVPESAEEPAYFTPREFSLQASDDVRRLASVPAKLPALRGSSVEPGECGSGNITFQIEEGEEPRSVLFEGSSDVIWELQEG